MRVVIFILFFLISSFRVFRRLMRKEQTANFPKRTNAIRPPKKPIFRDSQSCTFPFFWAPPEWVCLVGEAGSRWYFSGSMYRSHFTGPQLFSFFIFSFCCATTATGSKVGCNGHPPPANQDWVWWAPSRPASATVVCRILSFSTGKHDQSSMRCLLTPYVHRFDMLSSQPFPEQKERRMHAAVCLLRL